uniref:Uncharacterized protein n=1 Tax=Euplotes harpa TaxID=151035 RepID=A0A7S3J6H2_9SPIT|mmetsp:Transcript_22632/g.25994  ORF Transcript_22632/g.25994 Transcript_22632/m.25994 type:complete len:240 (+) Transcript_22632:1-720(+)
MHSRNSSVMPQMSANEKNMIKEIKRELIRYIPPVLRRSRRKTKELEVSDLGSAAEYGKTQDHMVPTVSFRGKCTDSMYKSIIDFKIRASTSQSTERIGTHTTQIFKEDNNALAEKLVYPSVKKLKKWMAISGRETKEVDVLKSIIFDHIKKNMRHLNLKITKEIEAPSVMKFSTNHYQVKLPEIQNLDHDSKIVKEHHKNGIMRRNKLLLEHILLERIKKKEIYQTGLQHYRTNISTMA